MWRDAEVGIYGLASKEWKRGRFRDGFGMVMVVCTACWLWEDLLYMETAFYTLSITPCWSLVLHVNDKPQIEATYHRLQTRTRQRNHDDFQFPKRFALLPRSSASVVLDAVADLMPWDLTQKLWMSQDIDSIQFKSRGPRILLIPCLAYIRQNLVLSIFFNVLDPKAMKSENSKLSDFITRNLLTFFLALYRV